ncbi:MAG: M4 family metallopeptidase [Deltaproteobacteria bacterium]|nr:M4 family metallopeptidase [Deltaproteobacteria bacterium]
MTARHLRVFTSFLLGSTLLLGACTDAGYGEVTIERRGEVAGDVEAALSSLPRAEVVVLDLDGVPKFIRGDLGVASVRAADEATGGLGQTLAQIAPVFRLEAGSLQLSRRHLDRDGDLHLRFRQVQNGLEVVGGDLSVHVTGQGVVYAAHGTARSDLVASPVASLPGEEAVSRATAQLAGEQLTLGFPRLVYHRSLQDGEIRLAYETTAAGMTDEGLPIRDRVFIDAHGGEVLARYPQIKTARNRKIYDANDNYSLPGTRVRIEGQGATGDATADAAYDNLGVAYGCLSTLFGRDSYDGSGGALITTVHYGRNYNNAYWNGSQMVFGDGDGSTFGPLARSLDVSIHEMVHGVTERSSDLVYQDQPGALNEAMSDILAATCEAWNKGGADANTWKLGEDIWTPRTAGDAMRYMDDPTADGQSYDWYPTRYTGSADNGGVHLNSGIPNLAFYLLSQGGSHPRGMSSTSVSGIGVEAAGKIFYRANELYLTSYASFEDARAATAQAAADLYGTSAVSAVHQAWTAVGVPGAPTTPTPSPTPAPTPTDTVLQSGQPVSGLSAAKNGELHFSVEVPAGASNLTVQIAGGSGDADLYVRRGAAPTTSSYDFRPYLQGNAETVEVANPTSGTWYVMVRAYAAFSGLELVAVVESAQTTPAPTPAPTPADDELQNGTTRTGLSAAKNAQLAYSFELPAGVTQLDIAMAGGSGDADLYVRHGAAPTTSTWDFRPYKNGNTESVTVENPAAGTWYVMVHAYAAFSGLNLTASWSEGGADSGSGGGGSGNLAEQEPNDTTSGAQLLGSSATVTGTIGSSTDRDIFRVDASGVLTLGLQVPSGKDYDLELYDLQGNFVARSNKGAGLAESIQVSAGSGTGYYVVVFGYNSAFSTSATYALQVSW